MYFIERGHPSQNEKGMEKKSKSSDARSIKPIIDEIEKKYPKKIPNLYLKKLNSMPPEIQRMYIPNAQEIYEPLAGGLIDPIGDNVHRILPYLIHRYPRKVLFLATDECLIHCRFCFRKNLLKNPFSKKAKTNIRFNGVIEYLNKDHDIEEFIFSGGDPFIIPIGELQKITSSLYRHAKHVTKLRFHTKAPVVDESIITNNLIKYFSELTNDFKTVTIVFHINNANEIDEHFLKKIQKLREANVILKFQSVLLKGVNDSIHHLRELFLKCHQSQIFPHYLHHPDVTKGAMHFYLTKDEGKKLYQELLALGNLPVEIIPKYVIELPKGGGKVDIFTQ